jgi:hypothetical protein
MKVSHHFQTTRFPAGMQSFGGHGAGTRGSARCRVSTGLPASPTCRKSAVSGWLLDFVPVSFYV